MRAGHLKIRLPTRCYHRKLLLLDAPTLLLAFDKVHFCMNAGIWTFVG